MLSNLASYLMGGAAAGASASAAAGGSGGSASCSTSAGGLTAAAGGDAAVAFGPVIAHRELRCIEDDDWLLVDDGDDTTVDLRDAVVSDPAACAVRDAATADDERHTSSAAGCHSDHANQTSSDSVQRLEDALTTGQLHRSVSPAPTEFGCQTVAVARSSDAGCGFESRPESACDAGENARLTDSDSENCPPVGGQLEESWYVAPPSTRAPRRRPKKLVTSPLENLLIEHPSMSIYRSHPSAPVTVASGPRAVQVASATTATIDEEHGDDNNRISVSATNLPVARKHNQDYEPLAAVVSSINFLKEQVRERIFEAFHPVKDVANGKFSLYDNDPLFVYTQQQHLQQQQQHQLQSQHGATGTSASAADGDSGVLRGGSRKRVRRNGARKSHQRQQPAQHQPDLTLTANTSGFLHLRNQKVTVEAAMLGGRPYQKRDINCYKLNRAHLERLNMSRIVSGQQQKLRRSDRQNATRNSFVNNNRKSSCQRAYNGQ